MLALIAEAAGEPSTGARSRSKGSSKGKGKASAGHEYEIVSRLSTLCISMDRRLQAVEDRSSYVCVIKGESLKKEVLTLRTAWKEDEKARREEHEAENETPEESCSWRRLSARWLRNCSMNFSRERRGHG